MDSFYDIDAAGLKLQEIVARRAEAFKVQTDSPQLANLVPENFELVGFDQPRAWRVAASQETDTEALFKIQGVLCAFELPPVKNKYRNLGKTRLYLRQSVRLTGLSTESFSQAMRNMGSIFTSSQTHFPPDSVNSWQPSMYEGHEAIDFHARYFTLRSQAPNQANIPFEHGVDPEGALEKTRQHDLIHGPDNNVQYLENLTDSDGMTRYIQMDPGQFQAGDIVEVTFAFVILPISKERYIVTPQLRALLLLDNTARQRSKPVTRSVPTSCRHSTEMKRKKPYHVEDRVEEAKNKLARMNIED